MASEAEKILLRFRDKDTPFGVSRQTLRSVAGTLGLDETAAIHLALAQLRERVLPRYERDDGLLSPAAMKQARSLVDQDRRPTSTLFAASARSRPRRPAKA